MDKKTVAVTVMAFLILIFFVAIGSTLSAFKVAREKVTVEKITIGSADGITIKNNDGVEVVELEVKSSVVGVRPATGDEDIETNIPSTVNDGVGTEGAYASFNLSANNAWEIRLVSCFLTAGMDENLDNVRVAIMEEENEPISGKDVGAVLAKGERVTDKEMVVVVWLDPETNRNIKGAKISVQLEVIGK